MSTRSGRLLLACSAALVALIAAEAAWRLLHTARFGPTTNPRYVLHDPDLGWRYRPGAEVRHVTDAFDVAVRLNAQGFRDDPFPAPGEASRPVVAALGDSQTFGWGVPVAAAFPALLEQQLGADVLDLGVSGYGTDQELLLWRRVGPVLHPQVVILTVCANDTREVYRPAMYGRAKPRFTLEDGDLRLHGVPVPRLRLLEWSHLLRSAWSAWLKAAHPPLQPDEVEPARRLQAALIGTLAEEVVASGARLLVVVQDEAWLAATVERLPGTAFLDVGPALAEAAGAGPVTFATDPHWNARGHAAVAAAIADALRRAGWLP